MQQATAFLWEMKAFSSDGAVLMEAENAFAHLIPTLPHTPLRTEQRRNLVILLYAWWFCTQLC